jgi:hypothetical protein
MPYQDTGALFGPFRAPLGYPPAVTDMSRASFNRKVQMRLLHDFTRRFAPISSLGSKENPNETSSGNAALPLSQRVTSDGGLRLIDFAHCWILGTFRGKQLAHSELVGRELRRQVAELLFLWRSDIRLDYDRLTTEAKVRHSQQTVLVG